MILSVRPRRLPESSKPGVSLTCSLFTTDKATRYFCKWCKAEMIVPLDTEELLLARCPEFAGDQNSGHDCVRIENPFLRLVECSYCRQLYKVGLELLREIQHGTCVSCRCGHSLVSVSDGRNIVQEALRIFNKQIPKGTTPRWNKELNTIDIASVILRCSRCRCLNRVADSPLHRNGFYNCGRCKARLSTAGDGPSQ